MSAITMEIVVTKSGHMLESPRMFEYLGFRLLSEKLEPMRTISRKDPPLAEILRDYTPEFFQERSTGKNMI